MSPNSACAAHRRVELRLAVRGAVRRAAIEPDRRASSRSTSRALASAARVYVPGTTRGPCDAPNATCAARGTRGGLTRIDQVTRLMPRRLRRRDRVDDLARGVEDLELDRPEQVARALVVGDHRAARRVLADERRVALDPAAARRHALLHRAARQERRVASASVVARQRAQRREVVDDPDAAAVRGDARGRCRAAAPARSRTATLGKSPPLNSRPRARRRRSRSRARTRCRGRAGPA